MTHQFFLNAVDNQWAEPGSFSFAPYTVTAALISVVLYIALFVLLFKKNKKIFAIGFLAVLFQLLIYIAGYNHWIFVNRIFCAHLVLIFCFWIVLNKNDRLINILLSLFFTLTVFNGLKYAVLDIHNPYSGAKETAEFIKNNIDYPNSALKDSIEGRVIVAFMIDTLGATFDHNIVRGVRYDLDLEAL